MNPAIYRILVLRPYSWIGIVLVGILANVISTKTFNININLFFDILTAFLVWIAIISLAEFFHRKTDNRAYESPLLPISLIILLAFIFFYKNVLTLPILLIMILVNVIYSLKIKKWALSGFSFMFRGILEVSIFLIILFFHYFYSINEVIPILLTIYFLTNSRNLIGDIRDIKIDKYTFPKKYGIKISYGVSITFILLSILIIQNIMIMFPFIIYFFILFLSKDAYLLHRIFVITTSFFLINYILFSLGWNLIFTNILFISTILNFTYPLVPRKSNNKR